MLLISGSAYSQGGACPSKANYLNAANALVTLSSLGVTSCYYISVSQGIDTNNGTSESTPWAHAPGMPGCTGNCASASRAAGTGYIFRGGDTWGPSNLGVQLNWSGTSSAPIYVGVDQTWFSGSSWSRPIFNCQQTQCTTSIGGSYVTLDNVEITGFKMTSTSGNPAVIQTSGNYVGVENVYIHNFTTTNNSTHSNAIANQCCGNGSVGVYIRNNVIDGSDSTQTFMGGILHGSTVANNVIRYVYNGMNGVFDTVYGNMIEHNYTSLDGDHCNMMFIQGPDNNSNLFVYNNLIQHTTCSGGVTLWLGGLSCSAYNGYAFNNVIHDTQNGNVINPPGEVGGCSTLRTWDIFNNTVECGPDSGPSANCSADGGEGGEPDNAVLHFINDHWITSASPIDYSVVQYTTTTDLAQTLAAANAQGYNDTAETFAFSPASSGSSTVGAGTNEQSLCTTISGINSAAGVACQNSTGYACAYNTTNHTVSCPAVQLVARPTTGAWDIGAYQSATSLVPPTNVQAVGH